MFWRILQEVVIIQLRIIHTKATKSHIMSRGHPAACHHCGQSFSIEHMLLECAVLQECFDEYYTATKSHIMSRGHPAACHHCGQSFSIEHMLLECAVLQECFDEYYTADSLNTLFETIPETCKVEVLREVGFFGYELLDTLYNSSLESPLIWWNLLN